MDVATGRVAASMATAWLNLVAGTALRSTQPAEEAALREAEDALGHRLSDALRELYCQSNGIFDEWAYAYVLPVEELSGRRRELREAWAAKFATFDDVFVIGQLGNGDLLMHPMDRHGPAETVIVWDHEDDTRIVYASDLAEALARLAG